MSTATLRSVFLDKAAGAATVFALVGDENVVYSSTSHRFGFTEFSATDASAPLSICFLAISRESCASWRGASGQLQRQSR